MTVQISIIITDPNRFHMAPMPHLPFRIIQDIVKAISGSVIIYRSIELLCTISGCILQTDVHFPEAISPPATICVLTYWNMTVP